MKKIVNSVLIIIIIVSLFGCTNNVDEPAAQNQAETAYRQSEMADNGAVQIGDKTEYIFCVSSPKYGPGFFKKNVEHLDVGSDVIIKATVLSSKNPDPELIKDMPIGDVKPEDVRVTLTTVRIDETLKYDSSLEGKSEIVVLENYKATVDPNDKNVIRIDSKGGTLPMKQGNQYLLFLTKVQPDAEVDYGGDFYFTGSWQGKYVINQKTQNASKISELTNEDLEFWDRRENHEQERLLTLAEEVYAKYIW
jgi:hypothetical protein